MSTATLLSLPAPLAPATRRTTLALMWLGILELAVWLGFSLRDFYGGTRTILLTVNAGLKFGASYPHLSAMMPSPVGYYGTGTQGDLLYHATALSDYFLFYRIGDLTGLDALFLGGLGIYLHRTVGRLPVGRAFTLAASRALRGIVLATTLMFTLRMLFNILADQVFQVKTQHLFTLSTRSGPGGLLYVVLGLVLGFCAEFFRRGQQLQQEIELTV